MDIFKQINADFVFCKSECLHTYMYTYTCSSVCVMPLNTNLPLLVLCETGLLDGIGIELLCYVVLLMMPVLGRMSDQEREVRLMASRCFASLVTFMPLEVSECA